MSAIYVPAGYWGFRVMVAGSFVADLQRGKSGWWLVTDRKALRTDTLRQAEALVARACERLTEAVRA